MRFGEYICDQVRAHVLYIRVTHAHSDPLEPGLVYHAHQRPLTSPLAALLDLSATIHAKMPRSVPTPASILRALHSSISPLSPFESIANALSIPPIHVDHVAEAIYVALNNPDVRGVVDVRRMRELIGWKDPHQNSAEPA